MQTRNNYQHDISNYDVGTIARIEKVEDEEAVTVAWDDRETRLTREDLDDLVRAYAITTHKAQGAEYPVVIAPLTTGHYPLLGAPVLYTAITRARERVVLVGTKRALQIAVQPESPPARHQVDSGPTGGGAARLTPGTRGGGGGVVYGTIQKTRGIAMRLRIRDPMR